MTAEQIAIFLAGLFAPFLIQLLKGGKIKGTSALWLTFGISFVLAGVAEWLTGGLKLAINAGDPIAAMDAVQEAFLIIFTLSQGVYKFFQDKVKGIAAAFGTRLAGTNK